MIIQIIKDLIPLVKSFVIAVKDGRLSPDELEALGLEVGLAIAEVLKDVAAKHK